jgi:hypothetical protein
MSVIRDFAVSDTDPARQLTLRLASADVVERFSFQLS